jgi:hypothetical protein
MPFNPRGNRDPVTTLNQTGRSAWAKTSTGAMQLEIGQAAAQYQQDVADATARAAQDEADAQARDAQAAQQAAADALKQRVQDWVTRGNDLKNTVRDDQAALASARARGNMLDVTHATAQLVADQALLADWLHVCTQLDQGTFDDAEFQAAWVKYAASCGYSAPAAAAAPTATGGTSSLVTWAVIGAVLVKLKILAL